MNESLSKHLLNQSEIVEKLFKIDAVVKVHLGKFFRSMILIAIIMQSEVKDCVILDKYLSQWHRWHFLLQKPQHVWNVKRLALGVSRATGNCPIIGTWDLSFYVFQKGWGFNGVPNG